MRQVERTELGFIARMGGVEAQPGDEEISRESLCGRGRLLMVLLATRMVDARAIRAEEGGEVVGAAR